MLAPTPNDVATEPGYTLALGTPLTWTVLADERRFSLPSGYRHAGVSGGLSVPLRRRQEYFGTLALHRVDNLPWEEEAIRFARLLAGLAAGWITAHEYELLCQELRQAHAASHQDAALKSAALNTLTELVVITDIQGYVAYVNPAFERETGFTAAEVYGTRFTFLKSEASAPDVYHQIWEALVEGRPWTGQVVNNRKSGPDYLEQQTITPVRGTSDEIEYLVAIKQVVDPVHSG